MQSELRSTADVQSSMRSNLDVHRPDKIQLQNFLSFAAGGKLYELKPFHVSNWNIYRKVLLEERQRVEQGGTGRPKLGVRGK